MYIYKIHIYKWFATASLDRVNRSLRGIKHKCGKSQAIVYVVIIMIPIQTEVAHLIYN